MAAAETHGNGYVRLTTLVAVALPLLTLFAAAIAIYVNLSIAPLARDIEQNRSDIKDMRLALVPRIEHEKDWVSQTKTDDAQDKRIEQLRQDFGGTYSLRDAIVQLQKQVDQIQQSKRR